jgi:hypothetical protein
MYESLAIEPVIFFSQVARAAVFDELLITLCPVVAL